MTREYLSELLGEIDDCYVEEAIPVKKRQSKKWIGVLAAAACVALAAVIPVTMLFHANATQDAITAELERLGVSDYTYLGETTVAEGTKLYRHYYDEATQRDYYFDAESGLLNSVTHFSVVDMPAATPSLSDAEREAAVLNYAQLCIAEYQIGELVITYSHFSNIDHIYILTEYYHGDETGTVVTMSVMPNADIIFCTLIRGEIFDTEPAPTIGEAAAMKAAQARADELAAERGLILTGDVNCALHAIGATRFYLVEIEMSSKEEEPYTYTCIIRVDAYSGAVLQVAW